MRMTEKSMLWVVYRMTIKGKPSVLSAVCEQGEWDAMERERPGHHTLVLAGIANEGEAERLARTSSGYGIMSKPSALNPPKRATRPPVVPADLVAGDVASLVPSSAAMPVQSQLS